ncbi:MAG: RsmE family RNA methyltransferase [Desulfobacteraceae bacterium]|nr:RsmE family RNA methyltransferase [Desulfobacteraceae bacterium]
MNLILLTPEDFTGTDRICLTGRRHTHIKKVLQAGPGDRVACGICNGNMGSAVITRIDHARVDMDVTLDQAPPAPLPVTLVLGLPRPKMLKRIIQGITSLGVKHIYLVNSWRVEKSFWQSPVLADEKLLEVKTLEDIGFTPYTIGPRILTVETAVTCLISRLFT